MNFSLLRRSHPLADSKHQLAVLDGLAASGLPSFDAVVRQTRAYPLDATSIDFLQVNVGRVCNQTCHHCHVDAGPDRRENMSRETAELVIHVLGNSQIGTLDITGGAPEMNPHFRWLVQQAHRLHRRVIDRCNLTVLLVPGFDDLPEFLADHSVEIVASLPCYLESNCDRQRGDGVFQRSVVALQKLNKIGYGRDPALTLTLVYNPIGPSLPPPQAKLEIDYRRELASRHGIEFTQLITITNMPISRFLDDLLHSGRFEEYMHRLVEAYNPSTLAGLMCRNTLSVDWQGNLFDCDFNQMLGLPVFATQPQHLKDFAQTSLAARQIVTSRHCFGCTAGAGSGCQGQILQLHDPQARSVDADRLHPDGQ
jgi:radical SAM/Cys-rich protein